MQKNMIEEGACALSQIQDNALCNVVQYWTEKRIKSKYIYDLQTCFKGAIDFALELFCSSQWEKTNTGFIHSDIARLQISTSVY